MTELIKIGTNIRTVKVPNTNIVISSNTITDTVYLRSVIFNEGLVMLER